MGLDDGVFPRQTARDGDDLLLLDPHVGDRDARSEDRQLLLDARAGRDRPPGDHVRRPGRADEPAPAAGRAARRAARRRRSDRARPPAATARERVVVEHPLQPFDLRNFHAGALVPERTWSFDRVALEGARALAGDRVAAPPFLSPAAAAAGVAVIELDQLVRFVQHPVRAFLRRRLGLGGSARERRRERRALGRARRARALEHRGAAARGPPRGSRHETPRSRPRSRVANCRRSSWRNRCSHVSARSSSSSSPAAADYVPAAETSASLEVRVELPDGRTLVGTVPGVRGDLVAAVTYSRVAPKHRLAAWVYLLALAAARPDTAYEAVTLGRLRAGGPEGCEVTVARIRLSEPPETTTDGGAARAAGPRRPLRARACASRCRSTATPRPPTPPRSPPARTDGRPRRRSGRRTGGSRRRTRSRSTGSCSAGRGRSPSCSRRPRRDDEQGEGWALDEPTRTGRYARRLWDGLRAREELIDR